MKSSRLSWPSHPELQMTRVSFHKTMVQQVPWPVFQMCTFLSLLLLSDFSFFSINSVLLL